MPRTAIVHAAAITGCAQKLAMTPVRTVSASTSSDAEMRVCANWRSNSWSKAGWVPESEVTRSRASRTRCAVARLRRGRPSADGNSALWDAPDDEGADSRIDERSCTQTHFQFRNLIEPEIIKAELKRRPKIVK